jgi:hypothetical protein
VIQRLLVEAGAARTSEGAVSVDASGTEAPADWESLRSPENYLGYDRTDNFASLGGSELDGLAATLRLYASHSTNGRSWGEWTMSRQATVLASRGGRIVYCFHARDLHLVMGPPRPGSSVRFRVSIDGQPPGPAHGLDVDEGGNGTVIEQRLYQLIPSANLSGVSGPPTRS